MLILKGPTTFAWKVRKGMDDDGDAVGYGAATSKQRSLGSRALWRDDGSAG